MPLMKHIRVCRYVNPESKFADLIQKIVVLIVFPVLEPLIKSINLFKISRCDSGTEMITYCTVYRMVIPCPLTIIGGSLGPHGKRWYGTILWK